MKNSFFKFKQFEVKQEKTAMKVTTDACLFGSWVADELKNKNISTLLDIGTGTGLLSLMIAQQVNADIDAIEIDEDAAIQAGENFRSSVWANRLHLLNGNILTAGINKKYEVIVSNPPFYENEIPSTIHNKNIAHHGEGLVLDQLPAIIKKYLQPGGSFFLLLPFKRFNEILMLLKRNELYIKQVMLVKQSVNHSNFRFMVEGCLQPVSEYAVTEMAITDEHKNYTAAFTSLLKDYYLYL